MKLSNAEVKKLSELARIKLTTEEIKTFGKQISSILEYVKQLDEVDTSHIKSQNHLLGGLHSVYKQDGMEKNTDQKKIINQFPSKAGNLNKVKAVMDT